jgi:hypothetical protein
MAHAQETSKLVEDDNEAKALVAMDNNEGNALVAMEKASVASNTVVTGEWVVFDEAEDNAGDGAGGRQGYIGNYVNPFVCAPLNLLA